MGRPLLTEMHCHNVHSNFHQADNDTPYDCGVAVSEQVRRSIEIGLDCLFVTNHNTLDGYSRMLGYQRDHPRCAGLLVLPAEEITTAEGAHVIAYGPYEEIPAGLPLGEALDEIRRQDAVSSAPHPFSLLDALRERAAECDLVEVFNSNNVDVVANARASAFAAERGMTAVAGSDSHVLSTLGRCTNTIDADASLDDVLHALRHGRMSVSATGYATSREAIEHFGYKVDNSIDYIDRYVSEAYPRSKWLFSLLLRLYRSRPKSYLWVALYRLGLLAMRRVSRRVNLEGLDPSFMRDRNLVDMFRAAL